MKPQLIGSVPAAGCPNQTIVCLLRPAPEQEQGFASRRTGRVQLGQRAALYCRVSTADQSCARQERDLTAFADRAGYEMVGIFKETGSGVRLDRAERRKVMALSRPDKSMPCWSPNSRDGDAVRRICWRR